LDEYAAIRSRAAGEEKTMDPRLEAIVERMLDKCILDGKYQQPAPR
jgi:26S proteasome regulatory subunit N2